MIYMRNKDLLQYAGMAGQIIATLGVAIFLGIKLDKKIQFKFPIATVLFPLLALGSIFWKVYQQSSK